MERNKSLKSLNLECIKKELVWTPKNTSFAITPHFCNFKKKVRLVSNIRNHGFNSSRYVKTQFFINYFVDDLTVWQVAILLLMWSFFVCCCKVCDFLQTLIAGWLKGSLKHSEPKPPRAWIEDIFFLKKKTLFCFHKLQILYCLMPQNYDFFFEYQNNLFSFLMDAFVVEHSLKKLLMDLSMIWCFHWVNSS